MTARLGPDGKYVCTGAVPALSTLEKLPRMGDLDRSFSMPSLSTPADVDMDVEVENLSQIMGGALVTPATSSMAATVSTYTSAAAALLVSPDTVITPTPPSISTAAAVSDALDSISSNDPLFPLANALKLFASSFEGKLDTIASSFEVKLDIIVKDNSDLRQTSDEYFKRTVKVEKKVAALENSRAVFERKASDALDAARTAEQGCVCDQLVVTGFPAADLPSVREAFGIIGDKIGVEICADAIIDARARATGIDPPMSGTDPDGSPNVNLRSSVLRSPEIFVRFAFPELRTLLLRRSSALRGLKASDVGFGVHANENIKFFEVLVPHRQNLFMKIRKEALRMNFQVWHRNGAFFCRKTRTSKPIKVFDVSDIRNLAD